MEHSIMSAYALDSSTGEVIVDTSGDLSMIPASCMKIVTTGAALHLLDPESRFETHLEIDGEVDKDQVLHGNLYIRGGGDPCLGSDRIDGYPSWKEQLEIWGDAVEKLGIKIIEGALIVDASSWEKAMAPPSWGWEDIGNYYGAGASGLSFCENQYEIFFKPGLFVGDEVTILRTDPPLGPLRIENEVKSGPEGSGDRACIYGMEFSQVQYIRGTIPLGVDEFSIRGAIPDPPLLVKCLFIQQLEQRGIVVQKKSIIGSHERRSFHVTYSPTIGEIVYWTNQKSINLYAEHLVKKVGRGTTFEGIETIKQFWEEKGVDLSGFNIADGAGLSRKNLVTARGMAQILMVMKNSSFFPLFFESLRKHHGLMMAKDGRMSLIRGYAGYIDDAALVILVNHCREEALIEEKVKDVLREIENIMSKK